MPCIAVDPDNARELSRQASVALCAQSVYHTHEPRWRTDAGQVRQGPVIVEGIGMAYDVTDVEYLRHEQAYLLARLYVPRGRGPFRSVVELHGGVWTLN